jgi:hypothetical protein
MERRKGMKTRCLTLGEDSIMKRMLMIVCCLFASMCFSTGSWADESQDCQVVQKIDTVMVNWTEGFLSATGKGVPPEAYHGNPQGRKMALAAAVEQARQQLLKAAEQIPIDPRSKVKDLVRNNDAAFPELREMIQKAEVVHQEFSTYGSVTVTIQMSMNGGFSQLVLPAKIKQIEPVKPISPISEKASGNDGLAASERDTIGSGPYTGMIVDARGIGATPCMMPRVCDESGQEIFGSAFASREFAVQHGMSGYLSDLGAAGKDPRVADHPLILKGLRIGGPEGTDIIVSNTDAARLRSAFENLAFLRQCRVLIIMDLTDAQKKG